MTEDEKKWWQEITSSARQKVGQKYVDQWNATYPVGTPVRYWPGAPEGPSYLSVTDTEAQLLGGHTPVVWVENHSGCIALTHVEAVHTTVKAGQ